VDDILVLKFAHVLEQLETEFYRQAIDKFRDEDFIAAGYTAPQVPKQILASILSHEADHTSFLEEALQGQALDNCEFNFDGVLTDVRTTMAVARVVEQVGVGAYIGGGLLIQDKGVLGAAASILTIEARHQSALNLLNGGLAIPQSFDFALRPEQVLALASPFISGCDLGIPANLPITITNTPSEGQRVEFDLEGIESENPLFCQMLLGGSPVGFVQPIDDCVIPRLPDGPAFIFITDSEQPLASNILIQNTASIKAGPTILFVDQQRNALGDLVLLSEEAQRIIGDPNRNNDQNRGNGDVEVIGSTTIPA
jgi:hypothetical protein